MTSNEAVYHIWRNKSSISAFDYNNLISAILVLVLHVYSNKPIIIVYRCILVVTVVFGSAGVSVPESQGYFTMCVLKDTDTIGDVTMETSNTAGSATAGDGIPSLVHSIT